MEKLIIQKEEKINQENRASHMTAPLSQVLDFYTPEYFNDEVQQYRDLEEFMKGWARSLGIK